jgi:hypothetical protein
MLNRVPIASTVAFLHDVSRFVEVGDDRKGAAFRDAQRVRHVAQPQPRIVRDAQERACVVREETPLRHGAEY